MSSKEKSIDKPILNDSDNSFTVKSDPPSISCQSITVPVQSLSPLNYDSSSSAAILEQFGTIIKSETVIDS